MKTFLSRFGLLLLLICLPILGGCTLPFDLTPTPDPNPLTLPGTQWALTKLRGEKLLTGTRIALSVGSDSLDGSAGCSRYDAALAADKGGVFLPGELQVQEQDCALPQSVSDQAAAYLQTLAQVTRFTGGDGELYLLDDNGLLLTFERRDTASVNPAMLQGVTWQLVTMGMQTVQPGSHLTLRFTNEVVEGDAGCRSFRGVFQAERDWIAFGTYNLLGETTCASEELRVQEALFTAYLEQVNAYWADEDRLELYTAGGDMLRFTAE